MRNALAAALMVCAALLIHAAEVTSKPAIKIVAALSPSKDWRALVAEKLPAYGHRNWIVIADSAYPAQSKDGIETIVANADQVTVVRGVMEMLSHAKHVTPIVYLDAELPFLEEKEAPGVDAYREQLKTLLAEKAPRELPHEEIISRLDKVSQTFRVLIIKTDMTVPYTSVFLQLDCAYWGPEAEKALRARMAKGQK